jgi:hypothetical protein
MVTQSLLKYAPHPHPTTTLTPQQSRKQNASIIHKEKCLLLGCQNGHSVISLCAFIFSMQIYMCMAKRQVHFGNVPFLVVLQPLKKKMPSQLAL